MCSKRFLSCFGPCLICMMVMLEKSLSLVFIMVAMSANRVLAERPLVYLYMKCTGSHVQGIKMKGRMSLHLWHRQNKWNHFQCVVHGRKTKTKLLKCKFWKKNIVRSSCLPMKYLYTRTVCLLWFYVFLSQFTIECSDGNEIVKKLASSKSHLMSLYFSNRWNNGQYQVVKLYRYYNFESDKHKCLNASTMRSPLVPSSLGTSTSGEKSLRLPFDCGNQNSVILQ